MKTLHTPGPWAIVERNAPRGALMIESQHGLIAVMESSKTRPVTYENAECNASLIAAAPELLQALIQIIAWEDGERTAINAIANARAIVAKATGESQ